GHALELLVVATRADLARLAGDEACANAAAGLDLARHLGRHDAAVDELAGAYAEACELAGRVEDAFSAWVAAADSTADPRTRARRLTCGAVVAWDFGPGCRRLPATRCRRLRAGWCRGVRGVH